MQIYLAGQYKQKDELMAVAAKLRAKGFTVVARWLDEPHAASITLAEISDERLEQYAKIDLEDIDDCDEFIFFSLSPETLSVRGGRHVEFGYALAKKKYIAVIGPKENVFHYLSWHPHNVRHHPSIDDWIMCFHLMIP